MHIPAASKHISMRATPYASMYASRQEACASHGQPLGQEALHSGVCSCRRGWGELLRLQTAKWAATLRSSGSQPCLPAPGASSAPCRACIEEVREVNPLPCAEPSLPCHWQACFGHFCLYCKICREFSKWLSNAVN